MERVTRRAVDFCVMETADDFADAADIDAPSRAEIKAATVAMETSQLWRLPIAGATPENWYSGPSSGNTTRKIGAKSADPAIPLNVAVVATHKAPGNMNQYSVQSKSSNSIGIAYTGVCEV